MGSALRRACVPVALAASIASCGGAAPLLHPAHVLAPSRVSFGAGVAGQLTTGSVRDRIDRGRAAAVDPSGPAQARAYADGVLTQALVAPRTSPWVAARVGLPEHSEAGLAYTGRSIRLDGRRAFDLTESWALSLGLGASAVLFSPDSSAPTATPTGSGPAEFELDARGWAADLPILVGYRSVGGFLDIWAGTRLGYERVSGELRSVAADAAAPRFDARGNRFWAGVLAGFSVGIPPVWLNFEVATTFHRLSGELDGGAAGPAGGFGEFRANAWTLGPSGAIVGKF